MNIDQFRQLPLGNNLAAIADHAEIAMIGGHVNYARKSQTISNLHVA